MEQTISILVWDLDDPLTVKRVSEAIEVYQSVVIPCLSAEALLLTLQRRRVDVVILNLQKPFEEAFHLLNKIKTNASQAEVIFVSEFDDETRWIWMEAIQCGAYEFLPKPLDRSDLQRFLVQATEKHHPVKLRKRPPAQSMKGLTLTAHKGKGS